MSGIGAALVSVGGSLLSGLFGRKSAKKRQKAELRQAQEQFNQQMDQTVARRVADAKRAGIHPLFALGASPGASPTITAGQAPDGNHMGRGIEAAAGSIADYVAQSGKKTKINPLIAPQIREVNSSAARNEAEAMLLNSQRKRIEMEANSGPIRQQLSKPAAGKPQLWVKWWDRFTKKWVWLPNSQAGAELPEAYGGYLLGEQRVGEARKKDTRGTPPLQHPIMGP